MSYPAVTRCALPALLYSYYSIHTVQRCYLLAVPRCSHSAVLNFSTLTVPCYSILAVLRRSTHTVSRCSINSMLRCSTFMLLLYLHVPLFRCSSFSCCFQVHVLAHFVCSSAAVTLAVLSLLVAVIMLYKVAVLLSGAGQCRSGAPRGYYR